MAAGSWSAAPTLSSFALMACTPAWSATSDWKPSWRPTRPRPRESWPTTRPAPTDLPLGSTRPRPGRPTGRLAARIIATARRTGRNDEPAPTHRRAARPGRARDRLRPSPDGSAGALPGALPRPTGAGRPAAAAVLGARPGRATGDQDRHRPA